MTVGDLPDAAPICRSSNPAAKPPPQCLLSSLQTKRRDIAASKFCAVLRAKEAPPEAADLSTEANVENLRREPP